jgi:hypothetical protein
MHVVESPGVWFFPTAQLEGFSVSRKERRQKGLSGR